MVLLKDGVSTSWSLHLVKTPDSQHVVHFHSTRNTLLENYAFSVLLCFKASLALQSMVVHNLTGVRAKKVAQPRRAPARVASFTASVNIGSSPQSLTTRRVSHPHQTPQASILLLNKTSILSLASLKASETSSLGDRSACAGTPGSFGYQRFERVATGPSRRVSSGQYSRTARQCLGQARLHRHRRRLVACGLRPSRIRLSAG